MSIKDDAGLLRKYDEITDSLSMTIKIRHDQIDEIVVSALMVKYKACLSRKDKYCESFENVLRFYLDEDEFYEMLNVIGKR